MLQALLTIRVHYLPGSVLKMNIVQPTYASEPETTHDVPAAVQSYDAPIHAEAVPVTEHKEEQTSHIVLAAEKIGHIGPMPITNTMLVTYLVMITLIVVSFLATRNMKKIPSGLQNGVEALIEALYNLTQDVAQNKAKVFFPFVATFFLFILTANWFGLIPGMATIGFKEMHDGKEVFIPLLRSTNSDLNITLGLALISAGLTHFFAVKYLGVGGYLKKWFALNPIMLFVGLLELVSEFTKVVSLSFRLFGNIFAGEVVLTTISGLFAFIAPLPFYLLEVLVGVVQAAVFMMLTLVFMVVLSEKHESH